jgi:cyclopropane fatty-acyl-phospholipid synthase-like methyltransferase
MLADSAAAERNKQPILDVLMSILPPDGLVLEIASGTGQHVVHFAASMPGLTWQPSDADPDSHAMLRHRVDRMQLRNIRPPITLDVHAARWPVAEVSAVVCINMIHIAPWTATAALCRGARSVLREDGALYLYGPFRRGGEHTAPSNAAFDASLRARNPQWGVRDLDDVARVAGEHGFRLDSVIPMPANNLSVTFR